MLHTGLPSDVIDRLPTPKGVALALTQACRRDDANLDEISSLVRTDPALSGRLLALANAAALGGRNVASVEEAVGRMGLLRVSQVALAFSLIDQHSAGACANFDYAGFWNRSLLMAAATRAFGSLRKLGVAGDLFTVGLLAQIGCLALATAFPAAYSALVAQDMERGELLAREQAGMGTDHLKLSVAMLEHWGIPTEYAQPFGLYEAPGNAVAGGTPSDQRAQLAHSAWQLAGVLAQDGSDAALDHPDCQAALTWLDLERDVLLAQLQEVESVWRVWLALIARKS
ncbi:HDOD domain-containing protein [Rhodoferax lacus]|nr:HDOD domain-containing protein [Rhodoferax lacus]